MKSSVRVALDLRLIGYAWGGTAHYGLQLARALARAFPELGLTILRSRRAEGRLLETASVREVTCLTPPHHRWEQITLPLELLRVKADLLHSIDYIPPFRRRTPAVITAGDLGFLRFPQHVTSASAAYYGQIGRAVHSAEHVLTYSESSAEDLQRLLEVPSAKITVTPLAADGIFQAIPDPSPVLNRHGIVSPYVLFVGTIEPRKNLPVLIRAFAGIASAFPEVRLVIAGRRGWLDKPVFALVDELRIKPRVKFLGAVPGEDLPSLYSGADVFAFPSLHEGFGLPVLEAMACGCPVLCSNASSLPEVAGDAAWLLPADNPAAWTDALRTMLTNRKAKEEMRARGLDQAQRFNWEATARQTYAVYERVLAFAG